MLDYDNDGFVESFFVNGTTLEGFAQGTEPTSHLYRNRGNGTFEDVTNESRRCAQRVGTGRLRG